MTMTHSRVGRFILTFLVTVAVALPACASDKPTPPLKIDAPPVPPKTHEEDDLTDIYAYWLKHYAARFREAKDYGNSIKFQHWAVADDPSRGQYDLACYYALSGNVDGAMYWLQSAAMGEGVDVQYAEQDSDLEIVRKDPRWNELQRYLKQWATYWRECGHRRETVVLPAGYKGGEAIPVIIGLHGLGSRPTDFTEDENAQELANRLKVAIVGISATVARGPRSFGWSEDIQRDTKHIREGLKRLESKLTPKQGALILVGFSQGAQLAAEIAARHPDEYAGAIMMSCGFMGNSKLNDVRADAGIKDRTYIAVCGKDEALGNIAMTAASAKWFRDRGAMIVEHYFPDQGHSFPEGYYNHLSVWTQVILQRAGIKLG